MITIFKIFENINDGELQEGYYVICKDIYGIYGILSTMIGRVVRIRKVYNEVEVDYGGGGRMFIDIDRIEFWSKDRDDLEMLLASKKYNL